MANEPFNIDSIHKVTFGKSYRDQMKGVVDLLSENLCVDKPKIVFGGELCPAYNCDLNTMTLPDEKLFKDEFNSDLKEVITEGVAHEMFHHIICIGKKINSDPGSLLVDAEEVGADIFAGKVNEIINGRKRQREGGWIS